MFASQLIQKLQELVKNEGDLPVVTGVARTSYGEEILEAIAHTKDTKDGNGKVIPVIDLIADDSSLVAIGGF
jgi:hypothetical protein